MPEIVRVFDDHAAVTPVGSPLGSPIPVAPVVLWVIVNAVLIQSVGVGVTDVTVLLGLTVIVPVAFTVPHPPVNGIL